LSKREANELVPEDMQPLKSSFEPISVKFPQLPDQIHKRVSDPPPQELMDRFPFVEGVNLYQFEPIASICEAPVPVIADAEKFPGLTFVAFAQVDPCARSCAHSINNKKVNRIYFIRFQSSQR
jgi:hypothetical protein